MIAFIVALAVSMTYYQFVYIPEANAKPILPDEVLNPAKVTPVTIAVGAALESNEEFYVPEKARATLGKTNKVIWDNKDSIPHTVTTDNDYRDAISGVFDSRARAETGGDAFVMPGTTFEFVFTKEGEYPYSCVPHPHMKAIVDVVPDFA